MFCGWKTAHLGLVEQVEIHRYTITCSYYRSKGLTGRERPDGTQPLHKGLRIGVGNEEDAPPMQQPLIRRYLVAEIHLGKVCDSYLPI